MRVKNSILLLLSMAILCQGCDIVRSFFGKPTSRDIERMRLEQQEARARKADSLAAAAALQDSATRASADSSQALIPYAYYIVAGSFKAEENAAKLRKHLTDKGYEVTDIVTGGGLYGVAVYATDDRDDAISAMDSLRENGSFPYGLWVYETYSNK